MTIWVFTEEQLFTQPNAHSHGCTHTNVHIHNGMLLAAAAASSEPKIATYAQKIRFSTFDPDMFPALGRPPGAGQ